MNANNNSSWCKKTGDQMQQLKWLAKYFEEIVSGIALTAMTAVTIANVIARYVFSASFTWGEEVVGALSVWCVFIGASACYKRGMHIGIDVVVQMLPAAPKKVVVLAVDGVSVVATAYLCYLSLVFALGAPLKRTQVLEIPYYLIDIAAFIGFGLMAVHGVRHFVASLRNGVRQPSDEEQILQVSRG